ncbi:MAG: polysaccharide pyruvyl transferase family protein [Planktothrix sp.]
MKLFYFIPQGSRAGISNFGDELNSWLWEQLLPGIFDQDETIAFLGMGTLLNNLVPQRVPNARHIIVFGSGVGYGETLPQIDQNWTIYCVRGPLSAQSLNLSPELAIADPAILIRRLYKPSAKKVYKFAYMPHYVQSIKAGKAWEKVCQQVGFHYIDARWSIEKVLSEISQTEILLTEAMHGAIVADALRVPWVCVHTSPSILGFKWQDWCQSMGVEYQPFQLQELSDTPSEYGIRSIRGIRGTRSAIKVSLNHWLNQIKTPSLLAKIANTAHPVLSTDSEIESLTIRLEEKLEQFKNDVTSGYFNSLIS